MISAWPVYREDWAYAEEETSVETIKEAVRAIRAVRTGLNVAPSRKASVHVVSAEAGVREIFEHNRVFFATLSYANEVFIQMDKSGIDDSAVSAVIPQAVIYIPFAELVDIDKEIGRLNGEKAKLEKELARSNAMLANEKFISKAPAAKVEEEKAKLANYENMMKQVEERLAALQKQVRSDLQ